MIVNAAYAYNAFELEGALKLEGAFELERAAIGQGVVFTAFRPLSFAKLCGVADLKFTTPSALSKSKSYKEEDRLPSPIYPFFKQSLAGGDAL